MKKNLHFILLFLLLNVFLFSTLQYSRHQKYIDEISDGLYTKNKIEILDNDISKYKSIDDDNVRIFIELEPNIKVLVRNNDWEPNLKEGRFFKQNEIQNVAVIGNDFKENLQTSSGKQYINFLNNKFEVVGVVGEEFKSKTDSLLFLNVEDLSIFRDDFKVVIDGESKTSVSNYIKKIEDKYGDLNLINTNEMNFDRNIDSEFFYYLIIIVSFILQFTTISVFIKYHFEKNTKLFKVQYILGFTKNNILLRYLKEISVNILISNMISSLIVYKYSVNFKEFVFFNLLIFIYSIIISICYTYSFFNKYNRSRGEHLA